MHTQPCHKQDINRSADVPVKKTEHSEIFNVEFLHEHLSVQFDLHICRFLKFILSKGGNIIKVGFTELGIKAESEDFIL